MKLWCDACGRPAPIAGARVMGGRVHLRCGTCGAEAEIDVANGSKDLGEMSPQRPAPKVVALRPVGDAVQLAAEAAARDDPFAVPSDRCPKCIGGRDPEALTCPHCGLVYVNYIPEATAPSAELAAAFRAAMQRWDDAGLHDAALASAARTGELSALGRLYRLRQASAPLDPVASRGIEEVLRRGAAAAAVLTRPSPRASTPAPPWQKLAVLLVGLALVSLMFALLRQLMNA